MGVNHFQKTLSIICSILILAVFSGGCSPAAVATPSYLEVAQQVAETQRALATEMAVATLIMRVTELSAPTNTPEPTMTPIPTNTPLLVTSEVNPTSTPEVSVTTSTSSMVNEPVKYWKEDGSCYYQMQFISESRDPQTEVVERNKAFEMEYTVKNTGTCTWSKDNVYFLYQGGDSKLGNDSSYPIKGPDQSEVVVKPGEVKTITIRLTAPSTPGTYYSYWILAADNNILFGYWGPSNSWSFGVKVVVE